jgi:hypothetical protein
MKHGKAFILLLTLGSFASVAASADTFAYAVGGADFGILDVNTGSFSTIAVEPVAFNDIALAPGGTLYGIANGDLLTVNVSTGTEANIGALPAGAESLAFGSDGTLYVLSNPGNLYKVNAATGVGTLIGNLGSSFNSGSDAGNIRVDTATNVLYATNFAGSAELFTVNTGTAAVALVGSAGLTDTSLESFVNGTSYGEAVNGAANEVVTVNPSNGGTAFVAGTSEFYNFAVVAPEPASLALFVAGLLCCLGIAKRVERLA